MWILKEKRRKKEKVLIVVDLIKAIKAKLKAVTVVRHPISDSVCYLGGHTIKPKL